MGKRGIGLLLALAMVVSLLPAMTSRAWAAGSGAQNTLRVGVNGLTDKLSPFFYANSNQDAVAMTQLKLLASDRTGAIVGGVAQNV